MAYYIVVAVSQKSRKQIEPQVNLNISETKKTNLKVLYNELLL